MEKGFYHPVLGYWQTVGGDQKVSDYQEGTIEVPLKPSADHDWHNGTWLYIQPAPEPDPVIVIPAVTLWERMTEVEGEQVEAAMLTQPFRTRQIFTTAQTYRSDHELWPLLQQVALILFGEERAVQLLAHE